MPADADAIATLANMSVSAVARDSWAAPPSRFDDVDYQTQMTPRPQTLPPHAQLAGGAAGVLLSRAISVSYAAVAVLGQTVAQSRCFPTAPTPSDNMS